MAFLQGVLVKNYILVTPFYDTFPVMVSTTEVVNARVDALVPAHSPFSQQSDSGMFTGWFHEWSGRDSSLS